MEFEIGIDLDVGKDAHPVFGRKLKVEASLDCLICQRRHRTVDFKREKSLCIKDQHPFPGQILDINSQRNAISYRIGYYYESFIDIKKQTLSQPNPTWGRISFDVECLKCKTFQDCSIQTNIVRPYTSKCRHVLADGTHCANDLFTEINVQPKFIFNP